MDEVFQIDVALFRKHGQVKKNPFDLTLLREGLFSVSVDSLPLTEYYVFFDHPLKSEQIKVKVYKTLDGKWYDKNYSEEAELYSPEFGAPEIANEIKRAIDAYELQHEKINNYF